MFINMYWLFIGCRRQWPVFRTKWRKGETISAVNGSFDPMGECMAGKQAIIPAQTPHSYISLLLERHSIIRRVRKYYFAISRITGCKNQQGNNCVFHDADFWR